MHRLHQSVKIQIRVWAHVFSANRSPKLNPSLVTEHWTEMGHPSFKMRVCVCVYRTGVMLEWDPLLWNMLLKITNSPQSSSSSTFQSMLKRQSTIIVIVFFYATTEIQQDQNISLSFPHSALPQTVKFFIFLLLIESQNNSPHKIPIQLAICENVWLPRVPSRKFTGRETMIEDSCVFCFLVKKKKKKVGRGGVGTHVFSETGCGSDLTGGARQALLSTEPFSL